LGFLPNGLDFILKQKIIYDRQRIWLWLPLWDSHKSGDFLALKPAAMKTQGRDGIPTESFFITFGQQRFQPNYDSPRNSDLE